MTRRTHGDSFRIATKGAAMSEKWDWSDIDDGDEAYDEEDSAEESFQFKWIPEDNDQALRWLCLTEALYARSNADDSRQVIRAALDYFRWTKDGTVFPDAEIARLPQK